MYHLISETGSDLEGEYDYSLISLNEDGSGGDSVNLHFDDGFGISNIAGDLNGNWYLECFGEIRIFDSDLSEIHRIENPETSYTSGFFRLPDGRVAIASEGKIDVIDPNTFEFCESYSLSYEENFVFPGNSEFDIIFTVIDNAYDCSLYGLDFGKNPELLINFSDYFEDDFAVMNAHIDENGNIFAVLGTDKLRHGATEIYKFEISK